MFSTAKNLQTEADNFELSSKFLCYSKYCKSFLNNPYNKSLLKFPLYMFNKFNNTK